MWTRQSRVRLPSKRGPKGKPKESASVPKKPEADFLIQVNGWTLYFHPLFLDQLENLVQAAEAEQRSKKTVGIAGPNTKLAAALRQLVFVEIPEDPARAKYR